MDERFPATDEILAVAEPEPPPDPARPTPATVGRGTAEAYMELLSGHIRELEEYLFDLTERRDELLAEEEYLTARIRSLRRTVERLEDDEDGTTTPLDSAVWSRLWERPPRVVAETVDPTDGRPAPQAIVDLRALSERGYLAALRSHRRARVTRSLLLTLAGLTIGGTLLAAATLFGPRDEIGAGRPGATGDALGRAVAAALTPAGDYVPATMPDVVGDRIDKATRKISEAGLAVIDIRTVPGVDDVVVSSDPTAGEAVAAGAGVTLEIGRG